MPRPSRGKTETIKQRAIYVYLPSLEMVEDWKRRAERAGVLRDFARFSRESSPSMQGLVDEEYDAGGSVPEEGLGDLHEQAANLGR